ncbi:hypothetical protein ACFWAP_00875 [Streptomyces goshikiensis]|uniref:hypothetical protein n=1 Tax=Streptomyces goshikiensis TaxID=1942 RepID=UPI003658C1C1
MTVIERQVLEGVVVHPPKTYTFTVDIEVAGSVLADILTTAVEGGINYWCSVEQYRWQKREPQDVYAVIREDMDVPLQHTITVATIREGLYRLIRREAKCHLSEADALKQMALDIVCDPDADYDAGDADNIVQAGLFNEIAYG